MSRISYGGKLKKDVSRSGAVCNHFLGYTLVDALGKQVGDFSWTVQGSHNAARECIFTDADLLLRLSKQLEMSSMAIYRATEPDEKAVAELAQKKVKTLDEVLKGV